MAEGKTQVQTQTQETKPAQITAEQLVAYQKQLSATYEQLKPKVDLFNALKEQGITTVEQLKAAMAEKAPASTEGEGKDKEDDKVFETVAEAGADEITTLKEQVSKLTQVVQRQALEAEANTLMGNIKSEIKDKKEYSMLSKALDPSMAYNIMRQQAADKEKKVNKPLTDYLNASEKQLREFYVKLGGKVEMKQESKPTGTLEFPAHPTSSEGGGDLDSEARKQAFLKSGANAVGEFDREIALKKEISKFIGNN